VRQSEIDEIVGELYLVPPARFIAARDELVRTAREAGNRDLARELRSLRRPTQSAWLVNLLAREERSSMEALSALGRELREAQTRLDGAQLRRLAVQRQHLIADLLDRARRRAAGVGMVPTDAVLYEVAGTLRAALVDLAASSKVLAGRLVRPMTHSGFGPRPHLDLAPKAAPPLPAEQASNTGEWGFWPVERVAASAVPEEQAPMRPRLVENRPLKQEKLDGLEASIRQAEAALAAAEGTHQQREQELAEAEAAMQAARDRLRWIEDQRIAAQSEIADAERHLAAVRSAQHSARLAVAEARQALEAARGQGRTGESQPPTQHRF
jgi:hypothetical protein